MTAGVTGGVDKLITEDYLDGVQERCRALAAALAAAEARADSEAEVLRLTGELRDAIHGRDLARLDTKNERRLLRAVEAREKQLREALEELVRREGFNFTSWDTAEFARAVLAAGGENPADSKERT